MSHGLTQKFAISMASNATLSTEVDLGRSFRRVYVDPTGAGADLQFYAATESGGTFRRVTVQTTATGSATYIVGSSCSGSFREIPAGFRYLKAQVTATMANGGSFNLICSD